MAPFTGDLTVILTLVTMFIPYGLCVPSSLTLPTLFTSSEYADIRLFRPKLIESILVC